MAEQADRLFLRYFVLSTTEENNAAVGAFPVSANSFQEVKMIPVRQLNKYDVSNFQTHIFYQLYNSASVSSQNASEITISSGIKYNGNTI